LSERDCDNVNWGKRTTLIGREARDNNQSTTLQRDCDNMNWNEKSTCTGTTLTKRSARDNLLKTLQDCDNMNWKLYGNNPNREGEREDK